MSLAEDFNTKLGRILEENQHLYEVDTKPEVEVEATEARRFGRKNNLAKGKG